MNGVYYAYREQMYRVAVKLLEDHHLAEDALQDALFGIARNMHTVPVHSEPQLRAYVLTAARNAALDLLPGKTRREGHLDVGTLSAESGGDLFEALVNRQDYDNLLALIRSLPMVYREVLMLRYVMELEPREISAVLSRKVGTVSQQITRGKKLLLAAYEREACSL